MMKKIVCISLAVVGVATLSQAALPESFSVITKRNIFDKDRKPQRGSVKKEPAKVVNNSKTEAPKPDYVLVGVFIEDGLPKAFIEQPKENKFVVKELNEKVGDYTLVAITSNRVTLALDEDDVDWVIGFSAVKSETGLIFARYSSPKSTSSKAVVARSSKKSKRQRLIERMKARRNKKKNKKNKKNKKRKSKD